jgi:hypothetical protein
VVLYIKENITFIYDPSALTVGYTTVIGRQTLQQAASNTEGIDPKMISNVGTTARLWRAAYGPEGFGQSTNMAGGWIGGGGNYGSECRCMCATFIVVVHALQWLWECGHSEGLSEIQCDDVGRNLDWLLGGKLTGRGVQEGIQMPRWVRLRKP